MTYSSRGDSKEDNPKVRVPPPVVLLTMVLAGLAFDGRLAKPLLNSAPLVGAGFACAVVGLLLGVSALGLFHRSGTNPEPWKPSSSLVVGGVYRFTRNPMYLGMLLLHGGIAFAAGGAFTALAWLPTFMFLNFHAVPREEAYLTRRFGDHYVAYLCQVRRWM